MNKMKSSLSLILLSMLILSQGLMTRMFSQDLKDIAEPEQFRGDFAVKGDQLAIWNGSNYIPVFIKGINLGVSVPGTQPGQLAATSEDYVRWFNLVKEAGYNTIRLYTLHFPRFYDELRAYNLENRHSPLLVIQGIWLEENDTITDLFEQTASFDQEIREDVAAVHGDFSIAVRPGKAYGEFSSDISPWVIGYLPGREIQPAEVNLTNLNNPGETSYEGAFFQLPAGDPIEVWLAGRLDGLMGYEYAQYQAVRPTGFSTWPTLDPIFHPTEHILVGSTEDSEQIDLADMISTDSSAGFFIGYHAYPYYPDFIIQDPYYLAESDASGPNNYLGYLKDLKAHYAAVPLIIAEYGVPSSWGSGHLSPSGMHHGGHSEQQQGVYTIRMLDNIEESGCAGGIQFSLIDEWYKQTWITNPYSNSAYRYLWHNITAPEQSFGILAYAPPPGQFTETGDYQGSTISSVKVHPDFTFFRIRIHMNTEQYSGDTLWVAFDTYESNLGESILPDGRTLGVAPDTLRAEFALQIPLGGDLARLFVIPGYDIYGIKDVVRVDTVVSTPTDNGIWNPVRWKTNYFTNRTQYIGELAISDSEDPYQFLNAVTIFNDSLEVRIPWTLINFPAPNVGRAMHYVSHLDGGQIVIDQQDTLSDGIALTLCLRDEIYQTGKFTWSPWNYSKISNDPPVERKKQSFHYIKQMLPQFNSPPIGMADTFELISGILEPSSDEGVLRNDFDIDGNEMRVRLAFGSGTGHGNLYLNPDGSFLYDPDPGFRGEDFFMYYLEDGTTYSSLVPVQLQVGYPLNNKVAEALQHATVYPNPGKDRFLITIQEPFQEAYLRVVDMLGREVAHKRLEEATEWVEIQHATPGIYLFILSIDQEVEQHRILLQ